MSEPDEDEVESMLPRLKCFHAKNPAIEHAATTPTTMPAMAPPDSPVEVGVKIWYTSPVPAGEPGGVYTLHTGALGRLYDCVKPGKQIESNAVPSESGNEARNAIGNCEDGLQSPGTGISRTPNVV